MPDQIICQEFDVDVPARRRWNQKLGDYETTVPAHRARIALTINLDAIARTTGVQACINQSGKSIGLGGLVEGKKLGTL